MKMNTQSTTTAKVQRMHRLAVNRVRRARIELEEATIAESVLLEIPNFKFQISPMHTIRLALRAPDIQIAHQCDMECLYPLPRDREINPHAAATASIMERERHRVIEDIARSFAHNLAQRLITDVGHAQDTLMRLQFFEGELDHHRLIANLVTNLPLRQLAHEARAQSTPPYAEYGTDPRLLYLSHQRPLTPEDIRDIDPREQERLKALTATRLLESLYRALLSGLHPLLTKLITHQDPVRGYPQEGGI